MQAQEWALASLWENIGAHGGLSATGTYRDATLDGQKQSPLSCLPAHSSHCTAQTITSCATGITQESSRAGGKVPATTPRPTSFSDACTTSQKPLGHAFTHVTSPASTTQPMHRHEGSSDHLTGSSRLFPSPSLSGPTFAMRQNLQLGHQAPTLPSSVTNSIRTLDNTPSSAGSVRDAMRKSLPPQQLGTTSSHLHATLARNRVDRRQSSAPFPVVSPTHCPLPPSRPHCSAKDRLLRWRPLLTTSASPSSEDLEKQYRLTALAWEPSTLASYASGLLVFHTWADSKGLPEYERAPASQDTLASFITDLAGAYAGDTIANYVQGLRAWHKIYDIPWKVDELHIQTLLKGARKSTPKALKIPKRLPLLVSDIVSVRAHLDLKQPLDAAIYACLTTTFFTAAWLGEFTVRNLNSFNADTHVKVTDICHNIQDRHGHTVTTFHIPHTKIIPKEKGGETVFWAQQEGTADTHAALANHLSINQPPQTAHLFAYQHNSAHRPLTKSIFLSRFKKALKDAGCSAKHGHSIRIGATLEYLLRGLPFEAVKNIGRWSSDSFSRYLYKHTQILAPYVQANPDLHHRVSQEQMAVIR